jgi:para-aminobenzoate synthetase component I
VRGTRASDDPPMIGDRTRLRGIPGSWNGGEGQGVRTGMTPGSPIRIPLSGELTPRAALRALDDLPGRVLLETASGDGGRSLLSAAPRVVVEWVAGVPRVTGGKGLSLPDPGRIVSEPFAFLEALQGNRPGGWMGYVGYEMADRLERLPPPPEGGAGLPDLRFGAHDWWVAWNGPDAAPILEGAPLTEGGGEREWQDLRNRMDAVRKRLLTAPAKYQSDHHLGYTSPTGATALPGTAEGPDRLPDGVATSLSHAVYLEGVERLRRKIRAGELFQANLTLMLTRPFQGPGEVLYQRLVQVSPAPYAAFMDIGGAVIASVSPESYLSLRGDRVVTRPIKGTRPRHRDPARDREARRELQASEKDRAENVMIVDLLRNDLSRVSRPGSVEVPRLLDVETHPTVHHLVSSVSGRLRAGVGPGGLLQATFPGGSITGAPKIRAMELLRELEPAPRGVYSGALGLVSFRGEMELSISIRTAVLARGIAWYGTGGGITLASDPEAEWQESLVKARAFFHATSSPWPVPVASAGDAVGRKKEQ